ncbi:MAG TPA: hypothetical protein VLC09_07055, partial [Polyangiaceae bacterium]|nr:hypothetical protein [Polyangiaceae bacterium]
YTWLAAVLWFGERPTPTQWAGMALVLGSYVAFSKLGKKDDIDLMRSRWAGLLLVGTLLGASSSLYDKHLLGHHVAIPPWALGVWFTTYHTLVLTLVAAVVWWPRRAQSTPFTWRSSIPAIALLLLCADQLYFRALAAPESLVAVVAMLRRASVLVSFVVGGLLLREKHLKQKSWALLGVVAGVVLLLL